MHSYTAYGLTIQSELPLPELIPASGAPEVVVRTGRIDLPPEARQQNPFVSIAGQTGLFFAMEAGALRIERGREIVVEPAPHATKYVLRSFIIGTALAIALLQRGRLILHASAVAIDGGAVAFVGPSGFGKSTTAAAFHARGHRVVSDDVLAVHVGNDQPIVFPGFPRLNLWPDAASRFAKGAGARPDVRYTPAKRRRSAARGFSREPLTLKRIYVLAEDAAVAVEPMSLQDALIALVPNSGFVSRLESDEARAYFLQTARLVKAVQVRRLRRPRTLETLSALLPIVASDVAPA
jgi:hypothetical protein